MQWVNYPHRVMTASYVVERVIGVDHLPPEACATRIQQCD